jgi:hopanoid biosynthesis associated RND transporter like protein HpnN
LCRLFGQAFCDQHRYQSPHCDGSAVEQAFPNRFETILAVVHAPTSEAASQATAALVSELQPRNDVFRSVSALSETPFFARSALLFLPTEEVTSLMEQLQDAAELMQALAVDPSLRGLSQALSLALTGVKSGYVSLDQLTTVLTKASSTLDDVLAGRPAFFSWRELVSAKPPEPSDLRRFVEILPILDYSALEPGKRATDAIRQTAADLKLQEELGARVRLTGPVPIADEEFGTLREDAVLNGVITVAAVLIILWLALHSLRIILAVFLAVVVGLAITAAVGLMLVGALNLISVAFAVLFVGIGVDFGIQFSVRYRAERYEHDDLRTALTRTADYISGPLTLAAAATAAGFLSFLPTDYKGLSELGLIAGLGMIIAYMCSITILPALLVISNPPGEKEPLGYAFLAPVDEFMERHRMSILIGTALVVIAGLPLLYYLRFDFNPMNLRSPKVESVATFLEVRGDPAIGANAIEVLKPSQEAAREAAERLANLPEVSRAMTIEDFVPEDQDKKLPAIQEAAKTLGPDLNGEVLKPPSDQENVTALRNIEKELKDTAANHTGSGAEAAARLAGLANQLADASPELRSKAENVFVSPLKTSLDSLRAALQAERVTQETLPEELKSKWLTQDGRARVQVLPEGDPNDNETLRQFARAVLSVEPEATGGPISILESGRTIVRAFIEAGIWALLSIAILLWLTLRRFQDVLLTLIPLLLAGVVTLELCVLLDLPLNFANIIALPLLLGIGVAFKIYYIMAWRAGQTALLQSPLTRAVFYSALTAAVAFGSLWFSHHPGTSSMGQLLALSLLTTLAAAVLFQPVLMGPPRGTENA